MFAGLLFLDLGVGIPAAPPFLPPKSRLVLSLTLRTGGLSPSGVFAAADRNNFSLQLCDFVDFSPSPVRAAATAASSPGAVPPKMSVADVPRLTISVPADFKSGLEIVESETVRGKRSTLSEDIACRRSATSTLTLYSQRHGPWALRSRRGMEAGHPLTLPSPKRTYPCINVQRKQSVETSKPTQAKPNKTIVPTILRQKRRNLFTLPRPLPRKLVLPAESSNECQGRRQGGYHEVGETMQVGGL